MSAENNNCFFIIGMNDEGNLSFKAIFKNDLYLEQVDYKENRVSQNIFSLSDTILPAVLRVVCIAFHNTII